MYTIAGADYNEMTNPLASLSLPGSHGWSHKFVTDFIGELQIWDGLKYRISYSTDLSFWGSESHQIKYYMTDANKSTRTSATSVSDRGTVWQLENTLTYDKTFGNHTINVVLGQSAFRNTGWTLGAQVYNLSDLTKPYMSNATGLAENGDRNGWGGPNNPSKRASLFARVSYNYAERYMLQATVRRDGSSKFGPNNKYATFPSFSLGWNVTNEKFMANRPAWFNTLKARGSWGKNGNDNIGDFGYTVLTSSGNNYIFGSTEGIVTGVKASGLANADLKWEESIQTDLGLDFGFLDNALTFTVDWYKKKTSGMLMTMNIPSYVGEAKPTGNVGEMENSGVEFEAGYRFHIADAKFNMKGNLSYLHNKLIQYGNDTGWANLDYIQTAGTITRAQNGEPFPFFYGLKTDGIFQNQAEIDAYVNADGKKIQPDAKPGYVRFVDSNGDGSITDDDRVKIGKGTPDWSFGFNFNASWRGFDFSMMWQGTIGNDICDATRRIDVKTVNLPSWMLGRWTGEGTSNKYPIFILGDNVNWKSSDLYIHDGSYLRLKNIQLGYTVPSSLTQKFMVEKLRFFVSAENLLTFTKYWGYDPEISSGGTSLGVDYGVYPQSRVWTVGFNIGF
jgi:TonB-linked SusC/RagA family outer membrane protein